MRVIRALRRGPGIIGTVGIVSYFNGASLAVCVSMMLLGQPATGVARAAFILAVVIWIISSLYLLYFIMWTRRAERLIEQRWGKEIDDIIDRDLKG